MNNQRTPFRKDFYRANWQIRASTVRVIGPQGKQLGIMSLIDAKKIATGEGLDLVEIAPNAKPPVVKIINLAKFKYEQEKKEREERKKSRKGFRIKEIRLTPFIGVADLNNRIERAKEFAKQGDRLRIVVKFVGRQITKKEFGYNLIEKMKEILKGFYIPEGEARLMGKMLSLNMKPEKLT